LLSNSSATSTISTLYTSSKATPFNLRRGFPRYSQDTDTTRS
jgi:hypothetical protein